MSLMGAHIRKTTNIRFYLRFLRGFSCFSHRFPLAGRETYLQSKFGKYDIPVKSVIMWLAYALASALFAGIMSILAKIGIKNAD